MSHEAGRGPFQRAFYSLGAHSATGTELLDPAFSVYPGTQLQAFLLKVPFLLSSSKSASGDFRVTADIESNKNTCCQPFPIYHCPKRGSRLDCALYCPCMAVTGGHWFFAALELIPDVSHDRSAD